MLTIYLYGVLAAIVVLTIYLLFDKEATVLDVAVISLTPTLFKSYKNGRI